MSDQATSVALPAANACDTGREMVFALAEKRVEMHVGDENGITRARRSKHQRAPEGARDKRTTVDACHISSQTIHAVGPLK